MDTQRQRIKMGGGHLFFLMYVVLIFGWIRVFVCVCLCIIYVHQCKENVKKNIMLQI